MQKQDACSKYINLNKKLLPPFRVKWDSDPLHYTFLPGKNILIPESKTSIYKKITVFIPHYPIDHSLKPDEIDIEDTNCMNLRSVLGDRFTSCMNK